MGIDRPDALPQPPDGPAERADWTPAVADLIGDEQGSASPYAHSAAEASAVTNVSHTASPPGRYGSLRLSIGRHPADLVRLAISAGIVLACLVAARASGVNSVEAAIFTELARLPDWSARAWRVISWFGWWPGIAAVAVLALYLGRVRMAATLAWAGLIAWLLVLLMHWLVGPRPIPASVLNDALLGPKAAGFDFPALHASVAAALATAAGPYLDRSARHVCWGVVVLVGVADTYLQNNLPLGAFAGVTLGWGAGTLMHLVLGAPGRKTSELAVRSALAQAGLRPERVTAVRHRLLRPQEYDVVCTDGVCWQMKIVRRLHRSAGPGYQVRRMLASLQIEREPRLSNPRHEVEHEAYVTLLAERAGVGTLPVLLAGEIEHGPPFLIRQKVHGRRLADLSEPEVDDALLAQIWRAVAALGSVHIVHHDLRASRILVDTDGRPRFVDFTYSRAGSGAGQRAQDIAELLVSIASLVGVVRAVGSARRILAPATLQQALPHLQTLALHRRFRRQLPQHRVVLAQLRETLAERLECAVPPFRSPVRPATAAMVIAGGLAIYLLLPELASIGQVRAGIGRADWWWLAASAATGMLAVLASSWTILGASIEPLPIGRTVAVQIAAAFTGRTTAAALGFYGINMSFLEHLGLPRIHAAGVLILNRAATVVVTGIGTALGLLVIGKAVPTGQFEIPWWAWAGAGAAAAAIAVFLVLPYGRSRLWRPVVSMLRELARTMRPALRKPNRVIALIGGEVAFLVLSAAGLVTTLAALEPSFPVVPVLAVFVVGSTLGQLVPTPGGIGAVEGALIAGLTAIGIPPVDAIAAALTARVLTFWLPVLPGLVAFRLLQHRGVI